MQIYVINLDIDRERMRFMDSQLKSQGLTHQRFAAVHHAQLSQHQQCFALAPRRQQMKHGEIGCALSHIELWKTIVQGPDKLALILEDDVHLAADFGVFLRSLQLSADEICIHRLETVLARVTVRRRAAYRVGTRVAKQLLTNHGGSGAYIINKPTAASLVSLSSRFSNGVDVELFDPLRGASRPYVPVYQWLSAPCIQDSLVTRLAKVARRQALGFSSRVPERMDHALFARESQLTEPVKQLLRPFVTLAHDAALRPVGRSRTYVRFG